MQISLIEKPLQLLINGKWVDPRQEKRFNVVNPSNEEIIVQEALGSAQDVDDAVRSARHALEVGAWSKLRPNERARLLLKLADAVENHSDSLAYLESLNTGKPLKIAKMFDIGLAAECLRYFAGWATKLNGETRDVSLPGNWHAFTLREPVGVVGLIVPWNAPFAMAVSKIAPALAAGCTVVLKPAELTPLTALYLGQLIQEVGFPDGVVNIVTGLGPEAGQALVDHPDVDKVSFTGSTAVGKKILQSAAGNLKRIALELGGKSPVFIFPDADLGKAIDGAARGIFSNTGQVCAAGSRLFVHENVFDQVVEGISQRAKALKVGDGLAEDVDIGPVISELQRNKVVDYIRSGINEGCVAAAGSDEKYEKGFFVNPTVLVNAAPSMKVVKEEIFGPVICVQKFNDETLDVLASRGNDTEYGLSSYIWTKDLSVAHKMAKKIKSGNVRINAAAALDFSMPFGGYKQSGWGRENGREGIEAYTEIKSIAVNLD